MRLRTRALALGLSVLMVLSSAPQTALATELTNETVIDAAQENVTKEPVTEEVTENETVNEENKSSEGTKVEVVAEPLVESDLESNAGEEDYLFTVDENGVLGYYEGKSSADIPENFEMDIKELTNGVVKSIPAKMFAKNTKLKSIVIPSSVETFEKGAFQGCTNLEFVAFENDMTNAKAFAEKMFLGCTKLSLSKKATPFKIPSGIESIGDNCFQNCTLLGAVDFSKATSLVSIGESAFDGCSKLERLSSLATTSIKSIGDYAFKDTLVNDEIHFPTTLEFLGGHVFDGCNNLGNLDLSKLDGSKLVISENCFANSGLSGIKLPDTLQEIKANTFANCTLLKKITIGGTSSGVRVIRTNAFNGCKKLEEVNLLASVMEVEDFAFADCTLLTKVKIYQGKGSAEGSTVKLQYNSFPFNKNLVVYGYGGNVEEWAGKHATNGVKYKYLYENLSFEYNTQYNKNAITALGIVEEEVSDNAEENKDGNTGNVTSVGIKDEYGNVTDPNKKDKVVTEISVGTMVKVVPEPATDYMLISLTKGPKHDFIPSTRKFIIDGSEINSNGKVQINAAFASKKDTNFYFDSTDEGVDVTKVGSYFVTSTEGSSINLRIKARNNDYGTVVSNPWLWKFSTKDTKYITVDENGKITPKASTDGANPDYATVVATNIKNTNVKIELHVYVSGTQKFDKITGVKFGTANKINTYYDEDLKQNVISVSKYWVDAATTSKEPNVPKTRDIKAYIQAVDKDGKFVDAAYTWTTANDKVAKVALANTKTNENTVQICGVGETTITATAKDNAKEKISFIVRVVDPTPSVLDSSIVVDTNAKVTNPKTRREYNAKFALIQSYNGEISDKDIAIVKHVKTDWPEQSKDFGIELGTAEDVKGATVQNVYIKIYTNASFYDKGATFNDLYIRTKIDGDFYFTKLPNVVVTNKMPAPKVKLTGSINTFYKGTANTLEQTSVIAEISNVAGYDFGTKTPYLEPLTTASQAGEKYDNEEMFVTNFAVVSENGQDYSKIRIKQNVGTLATNSKGKPVVSGYLCIPYSNGVVARVKVTIPLVRKAPVYQLSKNSFVTHASASGQTYDVQLIDKAKTTKTKTEYVDLSANVKLSSTVGLLALNPTVIDGEEGKIRFEITAGGNSKTNLVLTSPDWNVNEVLSYPVTVKVITKDSAPKLSNNVITLNTAGADNNCVEVGYVNADTKAAMRGYSISNINYVVNRNENVNMEAAKITVKYVDGKLYASYDRNREPKNGTYSFTAKYVGEYLGGSTFTNVMSFKVQVVKKNPTVALKTSTLTLNNFFCGAVDQNGATVEEASTTFTYKNMSLNSRNTIDLSSATLLNTTGGNSKKFSYGSYSSETGVFAESPVKVSFEEGVFKASLLNRLGSNQKFVISGAKVDGVVISDIPFTIKVVTKEPTITLAAKGAINVLDKNSAVTYTVKVNNYSGKVDAGKLIVAAEGVTSGKITTWSSANSEGVTNHFKLVDANNNTTNLVIAGNRDTLLAAKYGLKFKYDFGSITNASGNTNKVYSKELQTSTTLAQKMPNITIDPETVVVYSANTKYVPSTTIKSADKNIELVDVKYNKKTAENLQKAFKITYNKDTDKCLVEVINSALLKKNTTYTLTLEADFGEYQIKDSVGKTFNVKVNVR